MAFQSEQQKVAHLLRRFGLGASEAEIDYYGQDGLQGAIDRLVDYESVDEGYPLELQDFANPNNGNVNMIGLQQWWYLRLLATRRPLEQKLTVFWHDHFATSAAKVDVAQVMHRHIEILRSNATGSFATLLSKVSKDPAMVYWLDSQQNVKGTPNENFAREIMELFTLGVDTGYTEADIQEAARALTGWTFGFRRGGNFRRPEKPNRVTQFFDDPRLHDEGEKTVFGQRGNFNGDDVVRILAEQPGTAQYITKKMWEWFAYESPNVNLVNRLATNWMKKDLDIKFLVRSIMESDEFYSEEAVRTQVKNPIDFCISSLRSIGVGRALMNQIAITTNDRQKRGLQGVGRLTAQRTKAMGMELLYPPDVAGWVIGDEWISTATVVERIKFADFLFGTSGRNMRQFVARSFAGLDESPDALVGRLLSVFDAELPEDKVALLKERALDITGGELTRANATETMQGVSRLIFGSPEFQFC